MTLNRLGGIAVAILLIMVLFSCGTTPDTTSANAQASAANSPITFDLLAGQTNLAGTVTVDNDGTNLTISIQLNSPWQFVDENDSLKIYIGDGYPLNVSAGQFPYHFAGSDGWTNSWPLSEFIPEESWDGELIIAVHGDMMGGVEAEGGFAAVPCTDTQTYELHSNGTVMGEVTLEILGSDVVVTYTAYPPCLLTETHLFFGPGGTIPPFEAGHWNEQWSDPVGSPSMSYTVPLAEFGYTYPTVGCEEFAFAFHATFENLSNGKTGSATGRNGSCDHQFIQGKKPHWKNYTCATVGVTEWTELEQIPGEEETAWAQFLSDPFASHGYNRWGWFINYAP